MTHKEILEQTKSELDRLVSEAKRKLDGLYRPELESGKWYKDTYERSNLLVYITDIKDDEIVGYGFGVSGKWLAPNRKFYSWNIHNAYSFLVEATDQEVEDALVKEAVRRGFKDNVIIDNSPLGFSHKRLHDEGENMFYTDGYLNIGHKGLAIFHEGKWAEVIEKPVDKFAELKEAHKNGAVIQFRNKHTNNKWVDCGGNKPSWVSTTEYRIKPEEEPKVGDIVKAWDAKEGKLFIGTLYKKVAYGVPYPFMVKLYNSMDEYSFYGNAEKITKQEAIDLLFGKEVKNNEML